MMKVLFVSYEVASLFKFGGLGDVARSLPKALKNAGIDIRIGMPGYFEIKQVPFLPKTNVPMLYADHDKFFKDIVRHKKDPEKQATAYAYFAKRILEKAKEHKFAPDIIHINDWHTGLVPLLLKSTADPYFSKTKTILTVHNTNHQGIFQLKYLLRNPHTEDIGKLFANSSRKLTNFLQKGLQYADYITTVSPHFAQEILDKKFGFGVGSIIRKRRRKFCGIVNGIDYDKWNSSTDKHLYYRFAKRGVRQGKQKNKAHLQKSLGLPLQPGVPLFGFVARLTWQKGFDILIPVLRKMGKMPVQVVILGSGKKGIADNLKKIAHRFLNIVSCVEFNEKLAHQIYASSDFFLIPSIFEPCGLTQMISMAYGTIPVAAAVGGLVDTIEDGKTGLLFARHGRRELFGAVKRAYGVFNDKKVFQDMQTHCLKEDFSWEQSAKEYLELYKKVSGK